MSESKVKAANGNGTNLEALFDIVRRGEQLLNRAREDASFIPNEEQYITIMKTLIKNVDLPTHLKGKYNMYICQKCHGHVFCIDEDHGVTPFGINCKSVHDDTCDGMMQSICYKLPQEILSRAQPALAFRWRRPSYAEFIKLDKGYRDHIFRGGLVPVTV